MLAPTALGTRLPLGALVLLLATWPAGPALGQGLYGSVVGSVEDHSGASIPGASVGLTNRDTNLVLATVSNDVGQYHFTNVLPGTYDLKATLQGFREFVKVGVPVTAGTVSRVNVRLQVGALSETVTVQSEPALLQTDKADTHSEFSSKEVTDLPLPDFRNYQSLFDLVPGTTPAAFQNAEIDTPARALQTTVNGTNPNNNSTRVDGATNQFTWLPHHTLYVAPAETIAAVNVTTSSFSADQGLAGGASIAVTTKSGTNRLRGSSFAFYSDERMRARTYFGRRAGTPKQPSSHNIDGGTLGGPIIRNKLFYFGAFEGQYRRTEGENIYTVPTEKMRRGDFSDALNNNGSLQIIYDPRTGDINGRGREGFAGNIVPADLLNPVSQRINAFYPLPNRPGNSANYLQEFTTTFDRNQYDLKINWNRSSAHQIWGKVGVMDAEVSNLVKLGFEGGGLGKTKTWVATIGQTYTFSPTFVLDSTIGHSLLDQGGHGPDYGVNYGSDVLGIPGTNGPDIRQSGMPAFTNGMSSLGSGSVENWAPYTRYDPSWTVATNVTKLAGRHAVRLGVAVDRQHLNHWQPEVGIGPRGLLGFSGNITALRNGPQAPNFYNSYATFLLGHTTEARKSLQWELMSTREWRFGVYVGDRWQMHPRLTLDLGVRYEYFPLVTRANERGVERLDLDTMTVLLGGVGDEPRSVGLQTSRSDVAPRVGIAWRANERTVARGGYGLTYNPLPFARPLRGFYPLTIDSRFVSLNSWQPYGRIEDGIPAFGGPDGTESRVPLPTTVAMRTPDPDNVERGHIQSWNVTVERRLPFDLSVSAGYVGTKTTRGFADLELNVAPPGTGEAGRVYFAPFGRTASTLLWGGITRSTYHSLQVQLNRPFKRGLFLRGAYTLGKSLNMADQDGWIGVSYNAPDQFDRNYASAGFDRRHTFTMAYVYHLPFGSDATGIRRAVVKDWQLNGTLGIYTGTPFTVTASNTSLDQRGNQQTADEVAEPRRVGIGPDEPFYDPLGWATITEQRYGNSGRNAYRGPGFWLYNMSVFRTFPVQGRVRLQLRVEGFNVFNSTRWSNPVGDANSANFMRITGTAGDSWRRFRAGLRLEF